MRHSHEFVCVHDKRACSEWLVEFKNKIFFDIFFSPSSPSPHHLPGILCQYDIDECMSNPCKNGASCENTIGDFICHCLPESYGKLCAVTPCSPTPCLNGASCEDLPPGIFTCDCTLGYQGPTCSVADCLGVQCVNGGSCSTDAGKTQWECVCPQFIAGIFHDS